MAGLFHSRFGRLQASLVHVAHRDGVFHQHAEIMITLAADTDKPDADEFARVLTGGGSGAVEENVWGGRAQAGDDYSVAGPAQKFTAGKAGSFRHERVPKLQGGPRSGQQ